MSEGVVREVLSGGGGVVGATAYLGGGSGGGWGGGWGGGDSREWLAIAATAPLPLLGLSWGLLVSRLHRRLWRPVDVFVAALLSAGIAKQALTLAFALLSLLLLPPPPPDSRAEADDAQLPAADATSPVTAGMTDGGWSWDSSGVMAPGPPGGGTREEALCSAAVWGLTSAHALQAAALASLAADRALLALGSRPRRFRAAQARYHVCVLAVVSALVGAAGVFARGGSPPPQASEDDDPCLFLPHQLDSRFALFWICLHGGLLLSGAALVVMVSARLCCCLPRRSWRRGAANGSSSSPEDDSGCCEDEEEAPLPIPSPCDTSTAASTASTTASGRCGSTAALYAAASVPNNKCACAGGGTDVSMAFRWTEPPSRGQDLRSELRWSTVVSLMALYYILNHVPVLVVTVLGTFSPWLLPRRWPLGTLVLWAGLAQDALLPLVLTLADSRFAGWARRVYSGSSTSSSASPSPDELRRQHQQHQHQLRQQQLEQRRREQQKHLLHQQLQQQLQERRRRLEMTLDSPLPTARADRHEPYAPVAHIPAALASSTEKIPLDGGKGGTGGRPFHLAPPWKQKNSISVESLFTSKSDLSQQMSPPYSHQTLTTSSVPSSVPGSNTNTSTVGSGGGHMKFPLTNGSLFTVGADGRYPVVRNYRRGSNGGHHAGRIGLQMVTNPRCDASVLPLSALSGGGRLTNLEGDITMTNGDSQGNLSLNGNGANNNNNSSGNSFVFTGHSGPRGRPVPIVAPSETVINRLEGSDSEVEEEEPIYATLSSLEEDCEEEPEGDDEDEDDDDEDDDDEDDDDEDGRPASPMSSCSVTTAANDDFEYRDAKGGGGSILVPAVDASNCRRQEERNDASNGDDTDIEEVIFRLPERSVPSALGLYRLRLDELAEACKDDADEEGRGGGGPHQQSSSSTDVAASQGVGGGGALIRSPHNFHRRRYRRVPAHHHHHHHHHHQQQQHAGRRLGVPGVVLSVDSLQTALSRPDAVAYLDNGERMSGSVPDFKKVFVSEFI